MRKSRLRIIYWPLDQIFASFVVMMTELSGRGDGEEDPTEILPYANCFSLSLSPPPPLSPSSSLFLLLSSFSLFSLSPCMPANFDDSIVIGGAAAADGVVLAFPYAVVVVVDADDDVSSFDLLACRRERDASPVNFCVLVLVEVKRSYCVCA